MDTLKMMHMWKNAAELCRAARLLYPDSCQGETMSVLLLWDYQLPSLSLPSFLQGWRGGGGGGEV